MRVEELKVEVLFKFKGEIVRIESFFLKVSIVGKEIKVKYVSKKQNILINIIYFKRRGKIVKCRNIFFDYIIKECFRFFVQLDIRYFEKWQFENKRQSLDSLYVFFFFVFVVQKEENVDIVAVFLCLIFEGEKNKLDILFLVWDDCEVEFVIFYQNDFKISQNIFKKKYFFDFEVIFRNIFFIL